MYVGRIAVAFTACVRDAQTPFTDASTVSALVPLLIKEARKQDCIVPVYCFMPDHIHIMLLGTKPESNLKAAMTGFKREIGLWFGKNRPEVRLQKDYYDHILRCTDDWANHIAYVFNNPVRAGLVAEPSEYPFSGSYGTDIIEMLRDASR